MKRSVFSIAVIVFGLGLILFGFRQQFGENIDKISEIKAKGVVSRIINEAIAETFASEENQNRLFSVENNKDSVKTVQPNTILLNRMISDFGIMLQDRYEAAEPKKVKIPAGALTGSKFLSMTGLGVNIRILPLSVSSCSYESAFETQGINQTRYKIFLTVESTVRVLQPFSSKSIEVNNRILLAEMVIVGDVPESYVNVPKDEILDAIN
ncbi:MAG: sporulation protein YunB [Firmicutes bacterium]|nr:sporulation protein YunB [Bacillota bacterium]